MPARATRPREQASPAPETVCVCVCVCVCVRACVQLCEWQGLACGLSVGFQGSCVCARMCVHRFVWALCVCDCSGDCDYGESLVAQDIDL